ncbi:MAG TPA: extracellular solute-binding protein [Devosia sp.]|jgi:multiple sugar transport system substrate-binding protein|uniref:ABC transporter substrate-binding protein n=1 Tax=Devosia sp. TaxID=1871048 RepID=UPI002DDCDA43|nr:extracellular solute-binding protein [Devosia sp.]HEV2516062.1 extracellular solute-binding protein [Devosia sp.]
MTKFERTIAELAFLSRRSLLQGAAAGAAGVAISQFGFAAPAIAQGNRTVKFTCPDVFKFAQAYESAERPEDDGNWAIPTWTVMQAWKEKYPDVKLEITEVPWESITQRVILDAQAGTQADLVYVNDLNIPKLAKGGFLTPLDDFDGGWDEYNQYLLRGIASSGGKIYGLPMTTDCRHEMYWKEDFEKAGLSAPASTWSEFADQLSTLKEAGFETPYAFWSGNSVHTPTQTIFSQIWMLDSDVIDGDGRATLNTPEMHKVFEFYNDLVNVRQVVRKDLVSISAGDEYDALMLGHKVSVMKEGSWLWSRFAKEGIADKIGYFRTPRPTAESKDATLSGFWAFEIPNRPERDAEITKLAFEFGRHFSSVDGQASIMATKDGQLPTRPAAAETEAGKAKDDAWKFQASYAGEAGRGMPAAADSGLLFDQVRIAFQQHITGAASAEDALKAAETAYNSQVTG